MTQNVAAMELLLAAGVEVNVTGSSMYQSLLADVLGRGRFDCGYAPVAAALREAGAVSWRSLGLAEQRMPYVPAPPVVECETVSAAVQELIDSGADLDAQDSRGFTALHRASRDRRTDPAIVTALLAAGADPNAQDNLGRTPLDDATQANANNAAIADLLRQAGGTCRSCDAP